MEPLVLLALLGVGGLIAAISSVSDGEDGGNSTDTTYTEGDDTVTGGATNDRIQTLGGNDVVLAGPGNDAVRLGDGDDYANGEEGDDALFGEAGDDQIDGGPGNDRIFLGDGDDATFPDQAQVPGGYAPNPIYDGGDDFIRGGAGDDLLVDLLGSNTIYGDVGRDFILATDDKGTDTPDDLWGGYGDDIVIGDDGDTLTGGANADVFVTVTDENAAAAAGPDAPAIIADFDGTTDSIEVNLEQSTFGNVTMADLSFQADLANNQTALLVAGQVIAVVQGTTAIDPARVQLFTF